MARIHNTEMVRGLSAGLQQRMAPTLVEYPRVSQSTHAKAGPQKSSMSFLEGSGWRLQHVAILQRRLHPGCTLSPHATQQLSETEAASVVTRRQPWQVCRWLTGMSRRFPSTFFESRTKANAGAGGRAQRMLERIKLCPHYGQNASASSQIGS